jgi:hypothetical protein
MSRSKQRAEELAQFDPSQFEANFSSESDVSMTQSVRSRDDHRADKALVDQLAAISDLMKRIDNQLALKDKLLKSPVCSF